MQPMVRRSRTPGASNVEKEPVLCVRCNSDHVQQVVHLHRGTENPGQLEFDMKVLCTLWCCSGAVYSNKIQCKGTLCLWPTVVRVHPMHRRNLWPMCAYVWPKSYGRCMFDRVEVLAHSALIRPSSARHRLPQLEMS